MTNTIINRTPHDIVILAADAPASARPIMVLPAAPRGEVTRVEQTTDHDGRNITLADGVVQIGRARWGHIVGLPEPVAGVYHVVSVIVVEAAVDGGREVWDLLVPGDQVRDDRGRIVGCRGLVEGITASPAMHGARAHAVALAAHRRLDPEADNMRPHPDSLVEEAERLLKSHDSWVRQAQALRHEGGWSYDASEPHGALRMRLISTCRRAVTTALSRPELGEDEARRVALTHLLAAIGEVASSLPPGQTGLTRPNVA